MYVCVYVCMCVCVFMLIGHSDVINAIMVIYAIVNAEMIAGGYAKVVTFPPNVKHTDFLTKMQRKAREEGVGIWEDR